MESSSPLSHLFLSDAEEMSLQMISHGTATAYCHLRHNSNHPTYFQMAGDLIEALLVVSPHLPSTTMYSCWARNLCMMVDFWAGTYGEECGIFKLREFEALDRLNSKGRAGFGWTQDSR